MTFYKIISLLFISSMLFLSTLSANEWVKHKENISYMTPAPSLKFPHQIGVLRAKINHPQHPYITVGYFFNKGHILKKTDLSAYDYKQNPIDVQMKIMNHYRDSSVRFALLTFKIHNPSPSRLYNIALLKKQTGEKLHDKINFMLPDLKIKITTDKKKSKIIHLNKKIAMERKLWHKGPLRYEKRYFLPISNDLTAEFDISFFDNGHKKIEVALKHTAPNATKNINYKTEFFYNGKLIKNIPLAPHPAHTIKRYRFYMGYKGDNHAILNMDYLIKLGILPAFDIHQGINSNAVITDIAENQSIISQNDVNYIILQTENLKKTMLENARKADHSPIFFTNAQSQKFISSKDFDKANIDIKKSFPISGYMPFIITGERQYYDHLTAHFIYSRLKAYKKTRKKNTSIDIKDYLHIRKSSAFMNSIANDNDTYLDLKAYLKKDWSFLNSALMTYQTIQKDPYSLGELAGAATFSHHDNKDFLNIKNQDLLAIASGFEANLNIFPLLKGFSNWQLQFISERFLQKKRIFNSLYGFASYYKIKDKNKYFRKWEDVTIGSYNTQPFKKVAHSLSQKILPYNIRYAILLAAASNAQLYNTTGDIKALEAYGAIVPYFPKLKQDILDNPHLRITPFINNKRPLKNSHIILGQKGNDNLTNSTPNSLIHGGAGNDSLSVKSGSAYMFGGKGNDKITSGTSDSVLFGGDGKDLLIAGTGNDILQGDAKHKAYPDIFKFNGPTIGENIILDFTPDDDKIHISPKLNIAQYQYSNRLEGLTFDRRHYRGPRRNPKCDKLSQKEQDARKDCFHKYQHYDTEGPNDFEFIKELNPDIRGFIHQEKKRLEKSMAFLKNTPSSKYYKRSLATYKTIINQEKELNKEAQIRLELSKLSKVTDIGKYRKKENELNNILAIKRIIINNILGASRFGDSAATKLLNAKPIPNIGLRNYFRPAAENSTIIDFNINVTPEEHFKNANNPIGSRIGSILIKGIPPEKLTRDHFIFGY